LMVGVASSNQERVRVIIGFKETPDADLVRAHDGKIRYQYRIIPAIAGFLPEVAIDVLRQHRKVAYVELDGEVKALGDTLGWGVDRIDAEIVWGGAEDATDVAVGRNAGDGVKVAIIDTGIDWDHPDLAANYKGGHDFVHDDGDPMDDHGHGTHCAGIVAAVDNEVGVIGVGPRIWLYGVKVLNSAGRGYVSDVVAGIDWAVTHGMQIISMSLGSNGDDTSLRNACDNAYSAGVLLVAAAGNDGYLPGDTVDYPGRYSSVIAVAAIGQGDTRPYWSSRGPSVELAAPGVNVYSTVWDNGYATMSGTSMACPHVSGTAALVFNSAVDPAYDSDSDGVWDASEVREKLKDTADDLGPAGRDNSYGWGLVDADEAAPSPPTENNPPTANPDGPYSGDEDSPITFDGSGSSDPDGDPLTYKWDFGDGKTATVTTPTVAHIYATGEKDVSKEYTVTLVVNDGFVDSDPATTTAIVTGVNDPPIADAGGPYSGYVNQGIAFDASGSSDEEGTISYTWDFGDGSSVVTVDTPTTTHTYTGKGSYLVTLTVTDDEGATGTDTSAAEIIEEPPPPPQTYMYVESIDMSKEKLWYFKRAVAVVTIFDTEGNPVAGATVHGYWSGRVSWEDSRVTNSNGKATFYTPWIIGTGGTCTFTVEDVQKDGLIYNPGLNKETSDSISI